MKTRKTDAPAYIVSRFLNGQYVNDFGTYPTLEAAERAADFVSRGMLGGWSARARIRV